ncbi:MAG TPA: dihydrodipicolinate synthase family protein [Rugosimonospora sp.]|nr:dihydrodipicolinate synthase family protein [Rugosimonospora sp.]
MRGGSGFAPPGRPFTSRVCYAAAHVVADPLAENVPGAPAVLDWDATLAFRHHLWRYGFGVAEAMDTAQRGMGLDYPATRELIRRCVREARTVGGAVVAGVGTDQLPPGPVDLATVAKAYHQQLEDVLDAGAVPVLMCSRQLAAAARSADDYLSVYSGLISASSTPVVLHWLGEMFDPALHGYWGSADLDAATATVLDLIAADPGKVDGIKVSLLDAEREVDLRRRLPAGVRLYTGDDFHYPELIRGDEVGYSDALLGIFAAIAPAAATALAALDAGDLARYEEVFAPTVPLSRHVFGAPTPAYKTGIVFLAWLAGYQKHFTMVGGLQAHRSAAHLARALVLADAAGLLPDPDLAAARARAFLTVAGVDQ